MENARSPHDPSYKQFFSNPDMVASLLRDLVPEDFVNDLDFSTLEQCSGSYVTDDLRDRHDDIIWRVRWRDSVSASGIPEHDRSVDGRADPGLHGPLVAGFDQVRHGAGRGKLAAGASDSYLQRKKALDRGARCCGTAPPDPWSPEPLSAPAELFSA